MVIAAGKLIINRGFNIGIGLVPVYGVDSNTKIVIKGKIIEVSARVKVGNAEKIQTGALFNCNGVKNINNTANSISTDKIVAIGGFKKVVYCNVIIT